jgi:hypothetical protein
MAIYQMFEWEVAPGRQEAVLAMESAFLAAIQRIGADRSLKAAASALMPQPSGWGGATP